MRKRIYLEQGSLALAAFVTGIMAGFFWTYTFNVNLAMLEVDGETYATVQSLFNENVRHPMFFTFFFGGGAVSLLALAANWRRDRTLPFWLIIAAGALYVGGIIIFTAKVNLPLNDYTESWNPQALPTDWKATRDAWNEANALRTGTSALSFILYLVALAIHPSKRH
ncbi:DUF1772 domain-containing protein [Geitlerinema sp. PCC 9228]|jgi:uncharacterized membrane protein|uniref:DUF1772 domain-containing protein n=1 Tax=Geitlerinema sp. PCC 9228 TaxID=111611 RepID=UPI0008F994D2|nr:DUF1772 domain-containing protein [Geitlerinema sp. PCC 9228]